MPRRHLITNTVYVSFDEAVRVLGDPPREMRELEYRVVFDTTMPLTSPEMVRDQRRTTIHVHPTVAALLKWIDEDEERERLSLARKLLAGGE